jgi:septal ring factor EnvC (AmiA/AmiB activator)
VNPDLVVRDENSEIYTVRYDAVNAMLLNEFLKEHRKVEEQQAGVTRLKATVATEQATITDLECTMAQQRRDFQAIAAEQREQIQALTATLKDQAKQIQKVSAQIELDRPAPRTVLNKSVRGRSAIACLQTTKQTNQKEKP